MDNINKYSLKHKYLVFEASYKILLIDITAMANYHEIIPSEGTPTMLPAVLFRTWEAAEKYLLEDGAPHDHLDKARDALDQTRLAVVHTWNRLLDQGFPPESRRA